MGDKLTEICENRHAQVAREKLQASFAELDRRAKDSAPPRGFARALETKIVSGTVGLICEIKKASPSAGLIRPDFNPAELAKAYEDGGAACLSVLTEETYFQGRNEYLVAARGACTLPALRKDFMVDVWQVAQARAIGADCILLIMAALDDTLAAEMHNAAMQYGLDVLIEVHDAAEMERALRLPSGLIGINNRNLKTLTIDLATTETLVKMVPQGRLVVSESGLKTADDLRRMQAANIHAFLIGESLMRQDDVAGAVRALMP
ncbi:MAG TPA: indole-3-glycerol phosphate synthase TrpC [Rhodospirillaceae bacterium]|nr:indole-3-glycerol phosphate synthase TrpC [Rhodospirillaceae bacterium]